MYQLRGNAQIIRRRLPKQSKILQITQSFFTRCTTISSCWTALGSSNQPGQQNTYVRNDINAWHSGAQNSYADVTRLGTPNAANNNASNSFSDNDRENNVLFTIEELKSITIELIKNLKCCKSKEDQFNVITTLAFKFLS